MGQTISAVERSGRRLYPRKNCHLVDRQKQVICNISLGGVCLESDHRYQPDQPIQLKFAIPAEGDVQARGRVIHVESPKEPKESSEPGRYRYGISFSRLSSKDKRKIKHYVINRIKKDELTELKQRFTSTDRDKIVTLSEPYKITSLLKGAQEKKVVLAVFQEGTYDGYIEGRIESLKESLFCIKVNESHSLDHLSFAKPFSIYFDYSYHGYFMEARLHAIPKGEIHFSCPQKIYYTDRRNDFRAIVEDGEFECPVPYPQGAHYRAKLLDLSKGGAAFAAPMDGWYFLPGTPLRDIQLKTSSETRHERQGEVRYITPLSSDQFKVGVEFSWTRHKAIDIEKADDFFKNHWFDPVKSLYQKLQVGTHLLLKKKTAKTKGVEALDKSIHVARYKNFRGHEIAALINSSVPLEGGKPLRAPVVVIPPPYGKKKEALAGLALTIAEHFRLAGRSIVTMRFDFTNALGESYKEENAQAEGRHSLLLSPKTAMNDILASFDYAENNPFFIPDPIILLSLSYTSPMARGAVMNDPKKRVSYWINVNGTPHMQELIKNASGGIDYVGNVHRGMDPGVINFLGELLDGTKFCRDAIDKKMAFLEDARRDLASLKIPVAWIYGKYDSWVNPDAIRDVMSVSTEARRDIIEVPTGHMPTTTDEAFGNFRVVTDLIWRYLHDNTSEVKDPPLTLVAETMQRERARLPRIGLGSEKDYWKTYLVGEKEGDLGIDVLTLTDDYQEMMNHQIDLLDIKPGETILDLGCGTGGFLAGLQSSPREGELTSNRIVLADFIPEALERARGKGAALQKEHPGLKVDCQAVNLELSRLVPLMRFYRGEYYGLEELKGRLEGVPDFMLDHWGAQYDKNLHWLFRGRDLDASDLDYLESHFNEGEVSRLLEIHQAAQLARFYTETGDMDQLQEKFNEFDFSQLQMGEQLTSFTYPFPSEFADKIISSLVISYVFNPQEIIEEAYRILKPGGRLVASSFRPDADMTLSYSRMIEKVEALESSPVPGYSKEELLKAVRQYANAAAALLRYGEEGIFRFFAADEMQAMLRQAGFRHVTVMRSFGNPSQVLICSGQKVS